MNIIEALDDKHVFGSAIREPKTWTAWRSLCKALFALPMTEEEQGIFRECTGLVVPPAHAFAVLWLIIGRRGGKSFAMALVATYLATLRDWRPFLSPGERAVVLIVAADREQAKVVRRYCGGLLQAPMLRKLVEGETAESIELRGSVAIEVATCSFRSVRGRSVCAALLDETAFWRSEQTANPDKEVWRAIRASMAQFGDKSVAVIASSPYARRGLLYDGWRRHFGKPDATNLAWQAPTRVMNPTISESFIAHEYEADPISAASEYGAQFRSDVETFVAQEVIEAAVDDGEYERPPVPGLSYSAFVDPSGGASDSMTLAIGHREGTSVLVDAIREAKPPFSPEAVVVDFVNLLKTYGIKRVTGDRYAGLWPRERFVTHGVMYDVADRAKSDLYRDFLPAINGGRVRLLDHSKTVAQFCSLERRTGRGGRDITDHAPGGHDDLANCVSGLCTNIIGTGESDDVPFAESGRYCTSWSASAAERRDRLSPSQALAAGLISPERAAKLGLKQC